VNAVLSYRAFNSAWKAGWTLWRVFNPVHMPFVCSVCCCRIQRNVRIWYIYIYIYIGLYMLYISCCFLAVEKPLRYCHLIQYVMVAMFCIGLSLCMLHAHRDKVITLSIQSIYSSYKTFHICTCDPEFIELTYKLCGGKGQYTNS